MRLRQSLVARWEYGWQPADLVHVVRRSRSRLVPLLATAIVAQVGAAATAELPPAAWRDQLAAVADEAVAPGASAPRTTWSAAFAGASRSLVEIWTDLVQLLVLLAALPALEQLLPPPSAWARSAVPSRPAEDGSERSRVLNRIRTLLAKAEATEFAAEAETFTAKAQDLMTRHAIDEALLRASGDGPIDIRGPACTSTTRTRGRRSPCSTRWPGPTGAAPCGTSRSGWSPCSAPRSTSTRSRCCSPRC